MGENFYLEGAGKKAPCCGVREKPWFQTSVKDRALDASGGAHGYTRNDGEQRGLGWERRRRVFQYGRNMGGKCQLNIMWKKYWCANWEKQLRGTRCLNLV